MKVLRISQEIYPNVVGGGAYHAHALSRDQVNLGHKVTVLTIRTDIRERQVDNYKGYQVISFPSNISPLGNHISVDLTKFLWNNIAEYDIVHIHTHFYFASNVAAILAQFKNTPLVITNHSLISQSVPHWIAKAHLETLGKHTFNQAEIIFCYTNEEKDRLQDLVSEPSVEVVSNGIDLERFSPRGSKSNLINSDDEVSILFVGRFVEGKRPQDAIDALAAVQRAGVDARLYLCGGGPIKEKLDKKCQNKRMESSVEFLGYVDYDEMPKIYRAADIFVLPSRSEGFPRTVMESIATETPVVSSNLEQIRSIVEQAGQTVDPGDVSELADAIVKLARNTDLRESLGHSGRERLLQEGLNWSETVKETTELTKSVAQ